MKHLKNFSNLFQYQMENISNGIEILKKQNVLFDFSETGLGKTITSATIAINIAKNILVVAPKALQEKWVFAMSKNNINFEVCTKNKIPQNSYDLIIIDEAHNFQSKNNKSYQNLFETIHIHSNNPYIIQLTATPFQNNFEGLFDMLSLADYPLNSFGFNLFPILFKNILKYKKDLKYLAYNDSFKSIAESVRISMEFKKEIKILSNLLSHISIRSTRENLKKNYPNDVQKMGLFPNIISKNEEYDFENKNIFNETLDIFDKMPLVLYQKNDINLRGIFKAFMLKRMDSSVAAFNESINNFIQTLNETKDLDVSNDLEYMTQIKKLWENQNDNLKLNKILDLLSDNKKTIIFTEYIKTSEIIYEFLKKNNIKCVLINSNTLAGDLEVAMEDFDPENKDDKFTVMVTTDIMSEGTSLHKASKIINFDQKYNPSKLIQRFGRVNRINNIHKEVFEVTISTPQIIDYILKLKNIIDDKTSYSNLIFEHLLDKFKFSKNIFDISKKYGQIYDCMGFVNIVNLLDGQVFVCGFNMDEINEINLEDISNVESFENKSTNQNFILPERGFVGLSSKNLMIYEKYRKTKDYLDKRIKFGSLHYCNNFCEYISKNPQNIEEFFEKVKTKNEITKYTSGNLQNFESKVFDLF